MSKPCKTSIEVTSRAVETALRGLSEYFVSDARLTFVMRIPDHPDQFIVISSDKDLQAVAATILRSDREGISLSALANAEDFIVSLPRRPKAETTR